MSQCEVKHRRDTDKYAYFARTKLVSLPLLGLNPTHTLCGKQSTYTSTLNSIKDKKKKEWHLGEVKEETDKIKIKNNLTQIYVAL